MTTMRTTPRGLAALRTLMRNCEQTQGLSVLAHGMSVARYFDDLRQHVLEGTPLKYDWRVPDWVYEPVLWQQLMPLNTVRRYQIYHDCGKPHCREVDDQGRVHFPNHAHVSARVWREQGGDEATARLIAQDMDIHLLKAVGVEAFAQRPEAATLLLTGLAEVHSNAAMFGGTDSVSFKSKWKQIDRRGKAILKHLNTQSATVA